METSGRANPPGPTARRPDRAGWLVLALSAAYLAGHSAYGVNIWDAGPLPSGALRLLRGDLPYRDFYAYQPLPYLLAAAVFKFWETSLRAYNLVFALISAVAPWAAYRAARHLVPRAWALAAALLVLMAPGAVHARWLTICLLLGLALTLAIERRPRIPAWLAGLAAGGILLLNLEMGVLLGLMLGVQALARPDRGRRLAGLALGVAPAAIASMVLAVPGPGGLGGFSALTWHLVFNLGEHWSTPWPSPLAAWHEPDRGLFFEALVCWWAPLVYAAVAIQALVRRRLPAAIGWVLAWGLASQGLAVWRAGFGNSVRVLGPAIILQVYLAHDGLSRVRWRSPRARLAGLAGLAAYLPLALFAIGISVWGDEASGALAEVGHSRLYLEHPRLRIWAPMPEGAWLEGIASAIEALSGPGQPVLSIPYCSIVYFVSERPNPTYYEFISPGMLAGPEAEADLVAGLQEWPPALIVYRDHAFDGIEARRLRNYAPELERFVRSRFVMNGQIGPYGLWTPRGPILWDLASDLAGPALARRSGRVIPGASGEFPAVALGEGADVAYRLEVPAGGAVLVGRLAPVPGAETSQARLAWQGTANSWSANLAPGAQVAEHLDAGSGTLEISGQGVAWVGLRACALTWPGVSPLSR